MRTTAIAELRRGVTGDPAPWMAATGIVPKTIEQMAGSRAATIQDKWFARLFLVKALVIASLVLFWLASGFIALVISYDAAANILRTHNFPAALVAPVTVLTSLMDMSIGVLIAFRRSCAFGLDRRHCGLARLYGGRRHPDARPLDRAARRAGENRPGNRADAGRAADAG